MKTASVLQWELRRLIELIAAKEPGSNRWLHDRDTIVADAKRTKKELDL